MGRVVSYLGSVVAGSGEGCQVRRVAARVETRERSSEIPSRDIGHSLTRPPTALGPSRNTLAGCLPDCLPACLLACLLAWPASAAYARRLLLYCSFLLLLVFPTARTFSKGFFFARFTANYDEIIRKGGELNFSSFSFFGFFSSSCIFLVSLEFDLLFFLFSFSSKLVRYPRSSPLFNLVVILSTCTCIFFLSFLLPLQSLGSLIF